MALEMNYNSDDVTNLNDLAFIKYFWVRYHSMGYFTHASSVDSLDQKLKCDFPKLTKEDITTLRRFYDHLDKELWPITSWSPEGETKDAYVLERDRMNSIVKELVKKYN